METREAARRAAAEQAAEELMQSRLQLQGPYATAALAQIQRNNQDSYGHDRFGYEEIELGPVAKATDSTFAGPPVAPQNTCTFLPECMACTPPMYKKKNSGSCTTYYDYNKRKKNSLSLLSCKSGQSMTVRTSNLTPSSPIEPSIKHRQITRSHARRMYYDTRAILFEKALEFVFEEGYLHWYELMPLRGISKGCLALWHNKKDIAGPWNLILKELNALNGTNKCHRCEQVILLKNDRDLCVHLSKSANSCIRCSRCGKEKRKIQTSVWDEVCAKRTPDFVSCVDIIMSSGVLNWRERGGIRRISKAAYKVHREHCTCRHPIDRSTSLPFLSIDPRHQIGYYEDWTDYERCMAMMRYTLSLKNNLHSFYNFHQVTDPDCLPYGLARWNWFDVLMVNLQSNCPKRYAFIMHLVSLFIAQEELRRFPPVWYADAFVGTQHRPYEESFVESLASTLFENCLPATDEAICNFLRTRCYPASRTQKLLGPLSKNLSLFSPFFGMVPLDEKQKTNLPNCLEILNQELIDSMSMAPLCSIM